MRFFLSLTQELIGCYDVWQVRLDLYGLDQQASSLFSSLKATTSLAQVSVACINPAYPSKYSKLYLGPVSLVKECLYRLKLVQYTTGLEQDKVPDRQAHCHLYRIPGILQITGVKSLKIAVKACSSYSNMHDRVDVRVLFKVFQIFVNNRILNQICAH